MRVDASCQTVHEIVLAVARVHEPLFETRHCQLDAVTRERERTNNVSVRIMTRAEGRSAA